MAVWFYPGQEDYITKLNELGAIAELVAGQDGWSPTFAVAADGTRSVLQVVDWVGGEGTKPVTGKYVGAAGFVTLIADAVDIRGLKGDKGDEGDAGPANSLNIGTVVSGASASATISGTAPTQELNLVLPKGDNGLNGLNGLNGWSPVLAVATDGERRVLQVVDWMGGEGTKPAITGYIGATGIVVNIADAINVRGPVGAEGDTGPANSLSIGTVTGGATASATITGTSPSQVLNLVLPKGDPGTNGTDGLAATVAVGTVTTGAPGTSATVVNSGTSSAAVFDFTIPRGDTGAGGGGSGDVVGPASATNNGVALFDGTTGKIIKDGGVLGTAAFEAATSFATAAQGTKADTAVQPGSLATVATSGAYADLTGKPTLGTASTLNVPATGNAAAGEVVKGNDTRLSDSRTPTGAAGGVLSGSYPNPGFAVDMATQAELDAVSAVANSKLSDAPSDGKTYGRKDAAWAEITGGDSYRVGDVHIGTRHPIAGTWLELNNGIYLQSSYADLYAQLGLIQNSPGTFNSFSAITMASSAPSTETWSSIAEGANGVVVAISNGTTGNRFARSTNGGQTWAQVFAPIAVGYWVKIVYGNGTFVALNGRGTIAYSTDGGATWGSSALTIVDTGSAWVDVAFGDGYFVAIRSGTTTTNRSTNGISWSVAGTPVAAFTAQSKIAFGNGTFVTFSGANSYRSTDGANSWGLAVAMNLTVTQICFGNGLFVATNGGDAVTSPGGSSWSATKTVTPAVTSLNSFSFGNGLFYMTTASASVGSWDNFATTFAPPAPTGSGNIGCSAFINSSIIVLRGGPTASRAFVGVNYNTSTQFALPSAIAPDIKSWIKAAL